MLLNELGCTEEELETYGITITTDGGLNMASVFEYNGYYFVPVRKLKESEKIDMHEFSKHIRTDLELGMCDYDVEWKKHDYSHAEFYNASRDSKMDIFRCIDNGKLYVPCAHELFQFEEKPFYSSKISN